ncbi:hypothetical protein H310_09271 [Aphanomyces invadans]|uniref:Phytanoyl-CoA dioxygenase n=1 Tax=Aphanomyces invadans TaxID=157072 RepID=A0A024TXA9_9STRA|nr:hypothetical protein H310_09271 [Aphanomyces invadans]ETV97962.1 hypothetical protein H310_09271 [Aphanomyces invadans]|eukprot:XP_008873523.1 hypothetical protein H310_09271 [Aphanomyces invadans]
MSVAPKDGWACFDDSDDDEGVAETAVHGSATLLAGRIFTEIARHYPARQKAHAVDLVLRPTAVIVANAEMQQLLEQRLTDAGWQLVSDVNKVVDVVVDLVSFAQVSAISGEAAAKIAERLHDRVLPGGLVITEIPSSVSVDWTSELWSTSQTLSSSALMFGSSKFEQFALTRRAGVANSVHYRMDPPTSLALDVERQWIDTVTIGRTYNERQHGVLSVESHERAVRVLRDYGVVILRGLFDPDTVRKWSAAALEDFADVARILKERHDMDVFKPGEKPPRHNFVEFATREAFRCDLRHTPRLTKLRETHPDPSDRTSREINPRHPVVLAILEDVAQPDGGPLNAGNYGLWNFSFGGPGSRQPLIHGDVGAIVSTPGCFNQKIHADIPHLFNTLDLPPHLLHMFLPACEDGGFDAGQTAFVLESHRLATCARMMAEDGRGVEECVVKTIRPHLGPGDVVVFDCRVLHLGLANTTAARGAEVEGVRRPILYVNWHAPWFEDKKNWEPTSLFQ